MKLNLPITPLIFDLILSILSTYTHHSPNAYYAFAYMLPVDATTYASSHFSLPHYIAAEGSMCKESHVS